MIRRTKYLLVFSIVYWLVVIVGVILFSVSFQKVPIGSYGLKANFFNPDVDPNYYVPGLYNTGVGFYFILFPSTKQCLLDNKVAIINQNLQTLTVTYTLCYRYKHHETELIPIRSHISTTQLDLIILVLLLQLPM